MVRYLNDIRQLINETGSKTVLDYGCGKGEQWDNPAYGDGRLLADVLKVKVTMYDPGVPAFDAEPEGQFDLVVCTQVLGCIPSEDIAWVAHRLRSFARKAAYVGERLADTPKKKLHAHMLGSMPYGWTHDEWAHALRPRGGARLAPLWLRTNDRRTKFSKMERLG